MSRRAVVGTEMDRAFAGTNDHQGRRWPAKEFAVARRGTPLPKSSRFTTDMLINAEHFGPFAN
jgi:hypothetical protein